ncbi:hypothetical protein C5167_014946 [Papaver somniferum]|uniref:Major facilitator superfamily (MFS) profile domain-containing protein n=1 Tax=Papaver somniferum TaxID=3469 RepID=A0A4Y7J7P5_PAPSO|nr:sugar transport protein MST8-like [Papaver somniferum]RZC56082.1 hypothetical protein C5167_014946 [Papaver somniferum]
MAGGDFAASAGGNKEYPGNLTGYVFFTCLIAACGGLIFGYDIGISGGVTAMTPFLKEFFPKVYRQQSGAESANQYCKFNSVPLTLFTSSLYLAALVASVCASTITKKFGRKITMFLGGLVFLIGAAINGAAMNIAMLIIGRMLLGIGVGFANQSVPLYLSEMAPYKYRGALNSSFQLMITVGIFAANLINFFTAKMPNGQGWRVSLGLAGVPAIIMTVGAYFLPDTPNSIIDRNKPEEAKKHLQRIRGPVNIDEEYKDLLAASKESNKYAGQSQWSNLMQRRYRPQLVMSILIPFFQQFTGINVVMFYAPVLFKTIGFGESASLMSAVITGLVNMVATSAAIILVDKKGRRFLFLEGGCQMFIFQMLVAILIWIKFGTDGVGTIPKGYAGLLVVCICIFVAGFAWSWGPLGWLVPSEIYPLEIRSAAQSITVVVNMLCTFIVAQIFLSMLCTMKFGLFFFFGGFEAIMTVFVYFFLPETKGIPIEEMSRVWKNHWYWGRFIPQDVELENKRKSLEP